MGRFEGKTEKATPQRRREARRDGTVARSQEVGTAGALLGALLTLRVFGPHLVETAATSTRGFLTTATGSLSDVDLRGPGLDMAIGLLAPFLAVAVVIAVVAGVAQVGVRPTPKAAKPKLSHLSPKKGLEKFKPAQATWEVVRTLLKVSLLGVIVWGPISDWIGRLARPRTIDAGLADVSSQTMTVLTRALLLAVLIAAADYAYQRWRTDKQLKMSKDDVKREHKNTEGDPHVKGQRRRRQQEMSRNRMLGSVALADVVVTNPTHFAVALGYAPGDPAPRVLAKGTNRLALKIRREAHRNGVPVHEDRPTARALYRHVKIGGYVPASLFEAVAVVLAVAYRRTGRVPTTRQSAA